MARVLARARANSLYIGPDPVEFMEREMYIPETGAPITLHPEQRAVLRAMFARDDAGLLRYDTMLYSSIKKSAKTTIGAGLALWWAWTHSNAEIYIIGNDLRQADKRMASAMQFCIANNPRMKGARVINNLIRLPNGARIDSISVDPAGEAGMNPDALFFTEFWGAMQEKHKLLWEEAQLSPTKYGQSFRFVESYAGYSGDSELLEALYTSIIKGGAPHDAAPELFTHGRAIGYWNTRPYLPWQTSEYYAAQRAVLTPEAFARMHENAWGESVASFVPIEWWDACETRDIPTPTRATPVVVALDAGTDSDCFAISVVGRMPGDEDAYCIYERAVWYPAEMEAVSGARFRFDEPRAVLQGIYARYNVVQFTYDPWQLKHFADERAAEGLGWWEEFSQGAERAAADKALYDAIRDKLLYHQPDNELRMHVQNARRKAAGNDGLRITKQRNSDKIDLVIATAMALARARQLIPKPARLTMYQI